MNEEVKTVTKWLGSGSLNIFGSPFAGKDTQGLALAKLFGAEMIAGGEILRSHHDQQKVQDIMSAGGIIPTDLYLDMLLPVLSDDNLKNKPLILSSVGRSHGEEPIILRATTESDHPMKAVIFLNLSEEEVWKRFEKSKLLGNRGDRPDDSREALITRLKKFQEKTVPVINFYREQGILIDVDGAGSESEVTNQIVTMLHSVASHTS